MLSYTAANKAAQRRSQQAVHPQMVDQPKAAMKSELPWQERAFLPLRLAAQIAGVSVASLYRFEAEKRLVFRRLAGRTLVCTQSLRSWIGTAEPWTPSPGAAAARAARAEQRREIDHAA